MTLLSTPVSSPFYPPTYTAKVWTKVWTKCGSNTTVVLKAVHSGEQSVRFNPGSLLPSFCPLNIAVSTQNLCVEEQPHTWNYILVWRHPCQDLFAFAFFPIALFLSCNLCSTWLSESSPRKWWLHQSHLFSHIFCPLNGIFGWCKPFTFHFSQGAGLGLLLTFTPQGRQYLMNYRIRKNYRINVGIKLQSMSFPFLLFITTLENVLVFAAFSSLPEKAEMQFIVKGGMDYTCQCLNWHHQVSLVRSTCMITMLLAPAANPEGQHKRILQLHFCSYYVSCFGAEAILLWLNLSWGQMNPHLLSVLLLFPW